MIICSFCQKPQEDVVRLLSTPNHFTHKAYICDQCIKVCHDVIIKEELQASKKTKTGKITPEEIKKHADQYVIGQENAKKVLSVAIYNHYKNINSKGLHETVLEKSNVLLAGPSGVGKTHLVKTIASHLNLPFAIADATGLTEAGYVGEDAESMIERLIQAAGGDIELAQHGIIYIDEIDKKVSKVSSGSASRDVSGAGVQQGLLKIVEGSIIKVPSSSNKLMADTIDFDTTNVLFICGGTFVGIDKVISKDIEGSGIGFSSEIEKNVNDLLPLLKPQHLIEYGMIPEFVGRFPIITTMHSLGHVDLLRILKEPKNSILSQMSLLFELDNVIIEFSDEYLDKIVTECIEQKIGARGLRAILESSLLSIQYDLPTLEKQGINRVYINSHGNAECFNMKNKDVI